MTSTAQAETAKSAEEDDIVDFPSPYRFVRCNPRFDQQETIAGLAVCNNISHFTCPMRI